MGPYSNPNVTDFVVHQFALQAQIDEQVERSLLMAIIKFQAQQLENESFQGQSQSMEANNVTTQDTTTVLFNMIEKLTKKVDQLTRQPVAPN